MTNSGSSKSIKMKSCAKARVVAITLGLFCSKTILRPYVVQVQKQLPIWSIWYGPYIASYMVWTISYAYHMSYKLWINFELILTGRIIRVARRGNWWIGSSWRGSIYCQTYDLRPQYSVGRGYNSKYWNGLSRYE